MPRSGSRLHHLPVTQTPRESGRSPDSRSNRSPGLLAYRCGGSVGLAYCVCVAHRLPVSSGGASRSFPWTPDSGAGVWNIRPMLSTRTNGGAEGDRRARRRRMAGSATGGRAVWAVSEARLRPKLVERNRAASPVVSTRSVHYFRNRTFSIYSPRGLAGRWAVMNEPVAEPGCADARPPGMRETQIRGCLFETYRNRSTWHRRYRRR